MSCSSTACIAPHMRPMVMLALHTGMRRGEILNLEWRDLDFNTGSILIRDSKNGQPRHIPMDSGMRELLSGYIPTQDPLTFFRAPPEAV
jgi:integrase